LFEHHWNTALGWYNSDAAISLGSGDCQETSVPGNSSQDSAATQNEKRHREDSADMRNKDYFGIGQIQHRVFLIELLFVFPTSPC
jgi:hypothetical protein